MEENNIARSQKNELPMVRMTKRGLEAIPNKNIANAGEYAINKHPKNIT